MMSIPPKFFPTQWIFVRGLFREKNHWRSFPEVFKQYFPKTELHLLDLPGSGDKLHLTSPFDIPSIRAALRNEWLKLKAQNHSSESWGFLGISLGGMLGLDWCANTEDFDCLVAINTSAGNLSPPTERMRWRALLPLLRAGLTSNPDRREKWILDLTTTQTESEKLKLIQLKSRLSKKAAFAQLIAAMRFRAPNKIHCPALFLTSHHDRLVSWQASLKLAHHYHATLKTHPTANHDLPLDDGDWVCQQINDWWTASALIARRDDSLPQSDELHLSHELKAESSL